MNDHGALRLSRRLVGPRRILMTVDSVGGVWRYAMDLADMLRQDGVETVFAGFGPEPTNEMVMEAKRIGALCWSDAPLDWMAECESAMNAVGAEIERLASTHDVDLVHLNQPSQAVGLALDLPVVCVTHSCVVTWFDAVRGTREPAAWAWQRQRNLEGFQACDAVIAPSLSHAAATRRCYGIDAIDVVHNASRFGTWVSEKCDFAFAAGRWWDDGKNGAVLDAAAQLSAWPVVMAGAINGPNGQSRKIRHADYRGCLDHGATMALMESAAVFVSPSIYEPFGLAALEAACAGAVLLLADIPTYRELWGDAAFYFDPRDPEALAHQLNVLAANPLQRRDYGRRAMLRSRQYTLKRQASAILDIYQRVSLPAAGSTLLEHNA